MQLLIMNAKLRKDNQLKHILINEGKIYEIVDAKKKVYNRDFDEVINANGSLVTESLSSPHIHLDKVLIGETIVNNSGTLWEAIEKTWEYKRNYTDADIMDRASRVIDKQIEYGVTKFRTHVDIDSIGELKPLNGLLKVKEKYGDLIDLQIAAFPQEGIIKDEGTDERLRKAMERGADVLGGMPHNVMTHEDSIKHVNVLYDIAEHYNAPIDAHVDETDNPNSRTLELFAAEAIRRKFPHGVTADHTCALSAYNDYHAAKVIGLVHQARMNMVTNPPTNMVLQGRLDTGIQRVGLTRVKELLKAGVNVTVGQDCILDPYYPFGRGDMLEIALLTGHAAKMTLPEEIEVLYDFITSNAEKTMGLAPQGLKPGSAADIVILHGVKTAWDAIRLLPSDRTVLRAGKMISESKITTTKHY